MKEDSWILCINDLKKDEKKSILSLLAALALKSNLFVWEKMQLYKVGT